MQINGIKINGIEAIEAKLNGSIVYSSELEQLINYTILYDYGAVGESGDWEYKRITDSSDSKDTAFSKYTFTKNSDNIYLYGVYNSNKNSRAGAFTKNKFDMSNYSKFFVKSKIGTYGKNTQVAIYSFLEDNTNQSLNATTINSLYYVPSSGTNLTVSNPTYFGNISTTGNRKIAFGIETRGYYSNIGGYLYHLTLFKKDDWETLASKAKITATSISDVLTNSQKLLSNKSAVEFMIKRCTGDFMASALNNSNFLTNLESSEYKDVVYANEHWAKFLNML